jgi:acetyl-CoA carboxylase carboxyltransferase component
MTKEELGGASVHLRSGIVDNLAVDEHDALHR